LSAERSRTTDEELRIRAVIVDYGEVLCHLPSSDYIERFARIFRMDPKLFLSTYFQTRGPYDRGDLMPEEYWATFAARAGAKFDPSKLNDIRRIDVEMWCVHNEAIIEWVRELHSVGFKTAVMSNMPLDLADYLRSRFDWMKYFDQHIISAELRSVKPERAIYEHAIAALGVKAAEALFIDDREENVNGARAAGIRGLRFQSVPQLCDDLKQLGFTILPA
jgi:putative hydrolase of the HAD superfamily